MKGKGRHPLYALTAARVRAEKRPGMHADGGGLYLRVDPSGSRRWVQRITIRGRRHQLGLGGYPAVSLAEAREAALANRKLTREGGDPLAHKRRRSMPTFLEATARVIELRRGTWSNARYASQWPASLETYAFPTLGDLPVGHISSADVLTVLTPIWTTIPETARRVRQRIGVVMDWAIAQGYRDDNPAATALAAVLPKLPRTAAHHRAVPFAQVPETVRAVRESSASLVTQLALEFLVLTAARSGEVRLATWGEVDLASRVWTIPAARMKAGREHRVPLSQQAVVALEDARGLSDDDGLVFPSRHAGKALSDMTLSGLLRRLGIAAVPHGFRSSFRDWAAERTDAPRAVMEAALAHVVANSTEAAYFRSDLFDRRRRLMEQWGEYVGGGRLGQQPFDTVSPGIMT